MTIMKKKTGIVGLCMLTCSILTHAQTITPQVEQRAKEIVSKMTLQEKIEYISGYTSFSLRAIPRLGIPEIRLADGPQGIRNHAPKSTLYPSGILSASTWNRDLLYKLGQGLGQDAKARGVSILLGPGVNIYRAPLCGRNFEYFSEDPLLSGVMAAAVTNGVQNGGKCGVTIKHFACNNQEDNRMGIDACISVRALREIYLRGFEIAVKESKPAVIMTSYNLINGVHAAENKDLCTTVARNEWGFKGVFISDWNTTVPEDGSVPWKCIAAGNDIIMPGNTADSENLHKAYKDGKLAEEDIRSCAGRVTALIKKYGTLY